MTTDVELREMLPDEPPGVTVRELVTKIDGVDPGPEPKNPNAYRFRTIRNLLHSLRARGLARLHGSPRFPPMRWSR